MTKTEAYKIVGVSASANRSKVELAYRGKCKKLRLKLIPGMPLATRRKAQTDLIKLTSAWQIIKALPPRKARIPMPAVRKATRRRPVVVNVYRKPQTLAEAWQQVLSLMPFSEPVAVVIIIMAILLAIVFLLTLV